MLRRVQATVHSLEGARRACTAAFALSVVLLSGPVDAQTTVTAETPAEAPSLPDPNPTVRVVVESLAGLGMGAVFALGSGLTALGAGEPVFRNDGDEANELRYLTASWAFAGWTAGVPVGVILAGRARGRVGGSGEAFLGETLGLLLSVAVDEVVLANSNQNSIGTAVGLLGTDMLLMVGGTVLGFELGSSPSQDQPSTDASRVTVMPGLAALRGGGTVGVVGRF